MDDEDAREDDRRPNASRSLVSGCLAAGLGALAVILGFVGLGLLSDAGTRAEGGGDVLGPAALVIAAALGLSSWLLLRRG